MKEPGPNEILVQTSKTLISTGTEITCLGRLFEPNAHWTRWVQYPFSPGYSLVGRVIVVGRDVKNVQEGDRVALRYPHQQYVTAKSDDIYLIPQQISDEEAAWFHIATIVQTAVRRAQHELGDAVAVVGLGVLGQLVVQYLRLLGARQIIAIGTAERRLISAHAHGATTTLAMRIEEAHEQVLALTEGYGVNVVYDVTGSAPVLPHALQLLRRFGKLILLGDTGWPASQQLSSNVITRGLSIIGSHDAHPPFVSTHHAYWSSLRMSDLFFTYLSRGDMRTADLISHRYSPTDAPQAYSLLQTQRASTIGIIFDWAQLY